MVAPDATDDELERARGVAVRLEERQDSLRHRLPASPVPVRGVCHVYDLDDGTIRGFARRVRVVGPPESIIIKLNLPFSKKLRLPKC